VYILTINNFEATIVPYKDIILDVIILFNFIASIHTLYFLKEFDQIINRFLSYQIIKNKAQQQQDFIDELRSQRHDFSNHLQTIGALAQLNQPERIADYVQEAGADLASLNHNKYNLTTLELILEQKKQKANKNNIDLKYDIESGLTSENLSTNELFRLFYNLIDNALEAATTDDNPQVKVTGTNHNNTYIVSVSNNGAFIDQELKEKIKNPGHSTKGSHRGYGVYIISSLIEKANGKLEIKSSKKLGTEFICYL
jgi:sensor histidine kinase regulating citrate/malate metabolism